MIDMHQNGVKLWIYCHKYFNICRDCATQAIVLQVRRSKLAVLEIDLTSMDEAIWKDIGVTSLTMEIILNLPLWNKRINVANPKILNKVYVDIHQVITIQDPNVTMWPICIYISSSTFVHQDCHLCNYMKKSK